MSEAKHVFCSDIKFPSLCYAVLVRSPEQRGKLVEVRAPDLPEGYFLFTAADIPGKNTVEINGGSMPVLAEGEVSYIGEPVGIVAGPDYETAATLAERTEVVVEANAEAGSITIDRVSQMGDCSPFFCDGDTEAQMANDEDAQAELNGEKEEDVPQEEDLGDSDTAESDAANTTGSTDAHGASDALPPDAASQAEKDDGNLIITESFAEIAPSECFCLEHSGAAVKYKKDKLEVYTATRWPFHVKKTVAAVLSLSSAKIAVIPTDIASNSEGKILVPSLAAAQAALAAFRCKKPVKLIFSRNEELQYFSKTPPVKIKIKSAAAPSGKIRAMQTDIEINPGSCTPFINEITERMVAASRGFYNIENSKTCVRFAASSLPPMMPSGFGESDVFLALAMHIDILSRQLDIMPQEVRQANIADAKYSSILKAICEAAGFDRKYTAYENLDKRRGGIKDGPVRGIGLSLGYQGSGFLSAWQEGIQYSVEITMETTGEVHVKCGSYSSSIKEIIRSLVSGLLSIEKSLIRFVDADPDDASFSGPDLLSSSAAIIAPLVSKCCSSIQRQRFRMPLPITVKKTYKPAKANAAFVSFLPGACIAELELNPLDFSIKTRGLWIACAAGKLLNNQDAEKSIKQAAKMSLARLTAETAKIEGGRFISTSRFGSSIPAFCPAPDPKVLLLDSKEIPCGLDSIARNLLPGAYCAAIAQITRKTEIKLPVTTKYLYRCFAGST